MTTKRKSSHGPLIAILGGTALIVIAVCGGVVFLIASGVSSMGAMVEARRGPSEIVDEDYRVRVTLPSDGDTTWELWGPELARGWSPDGIVVLRNETCAAGLVVSPRASSISLDDELATFYADLPGMPTIPAPRGASGLGRALATVEDGSTTRAFEHGNTLYRVVGRSPCTEALYGVIEVLPGEITRRWTTPPIENATGRSYRVVDRVFESAATGLRVEATEPFSLVLEDLVRDHSGAEVVVIHRDGGSVSFDPYLGALPGFEGADSFVVSLFDGDATFVRTDPDSAYWSAVARSGDMSITVHAWGSERAIVERVVRELAPRVSTLDPAALASLRASLPPPSDRRAGETWSLRDGVFLEHPAESRPRARLTIPLGTDVVAGSELAWREFDEAEGRVLGLDRRDLGASGRLLVARTELTDARAHLAATSAFPEPLDPERVEGDAARAWVERRLDTIGPAPRTMRTIVLVRDGWAFTLELWWRPERADEAHVHAEALDRDFVVEGPEVAMPERRRTTDRRLGFSIEGGDLGSRSQSTEAVGEARAFASTLSSGQDWTAVVAVSDPRPSTCLGLALDLIELDRTVGAAWTQPATPTEVDGRPATMRVWRDVGAITRVVETRIDRTAYVIVIHGTRTYDWQGALGRVELDP